MNRTVIKTGLNRENMIAVATQVNTISMFVNKQQVAQVQDRSATEGYLGSAAVDHGDATNAIFQNATLWTL